MGPALVCLCSASYTNDLHRNLLPTPSTHPPRRGLERLSPTQHRTHAKRPIPASLSTPACRNETRAADGVGAGYLLDMRAPTKKRGTTFFYRQESEESPLVTMTTAKRQRGNAGIAVPTRCVDGCLLQKPHVDCAPSQNSEK